MRRISLLPAKIRGTFPPGRLTAVQIGENHQVVREDSQDITSNARGKFSAVKSPSRPRLPGADKAAKSAAAAVSALGCRGVWPAVRAA